jgi:hypothetical protein
MTGHAPDERYFEQIADRLARDEAAPLSLRAEVQAHAHEHEHEHGELAPAEESHLDELLRLWRERKLTPEPVRLGPMPDHAPEPRRLIAEQLELLIGLRLREGITEALPYARSRAVQAGFVTTKRGASKALGWLHAVGVVRCIGEGPKFGKGNGTKLFVPPGWRPADPDALTLAQEHQDGQALSEIDWIPDDPSVEAQS